jgi:hypothetical protein
MTQGLDGRRGVVFAVVAVVLVAVGVFLLPSGSSDEQEARPRPQAAQEGAATPAAGRSGSAVPTQAASARPDEFDIYEYLPWTREQLAGSADVARRFLAQYATHRHDEDPISYAERLRSFTTAELAESLTRTVTDPARVEQERADQVVSDGTAKIRSIRTFGENSITWVGTATERITAASGAKEVVQEYAVTTIQVGDAWRVYDFNPAEAGQDGDAQGSDLTGQAADGQGG